MSLVVIPLAGVAAMSVYDVRDSQYSQEAHERHTVVATVVETETDGAGSTAVQARWPVSSTLEHNGGPHQGHWSSSSTAIGSAGAAI